MTHSTAPRYRGESATYVQAWTVTGPWEGTVYSQGVALDKMAEGCNIESLTIVRHDDGSREYLPGTIASHVRSHREGRPAPMPSIISTEGTCQKCHETVVNAEAGDPHFVRADGTECGGTVTPAGAWMA